MCLRCVEWCAGRWPGENCSDYKGPGAALTGALQNIKQSPWTKPLPMRKGQSCGHFGAAKTQSQSLRHWRRRDYQPVRPVSMTPLNRRHLQLTPAVSPAGSSCSPSHVQVAAPTEEGRLLRVGDLAKATEKTVRALHLYESLGLIEPERRSKAKYRLFAPEMKVRIRWISKLQSLGLSLTEIQAISQKRQASESARVAAEELREVYTGKLAEVRRAISEYQSLERELEASLVFLDDCHSSCTSGEGAHGCSSCQRHSDTAANAPDLILGAQLDAASLRHG